MTRGCCRKAALPLPPPPPPTPGVAPPCIKGLWLRNAGLTDGPAPTTCMEPLALHSTRPLPGICWLGCPGPGVAGDMQGRAASPALEFVWMLTAERTSCTGCMTARVGLLSLVSIKHGVTPPHDTGAERKRGPAPAMLMLAKLGTTVTGVSCPSFSAIVWTETSPSQNLSNGPLCRALSRAAIVLRLAACTSKESGPSESKLKPQFASRSCFEAPWAPEL
mmetsp:Transcript_22699/g.63816  ORF Transcript_22699/g.63816 Transcript_22699/m.63816 type:complete len:220 (+) Transcript_22699:439-1098(+)